MKNEELRTKNEKRMIAATYQAVPHPSFSVLHSSFTHSLRSQHHEVRNEPVAVDDRR